MGDDIVARLRDQAQAPALAWLTDAADEIERLREWCDILANNHCECEPDMAAQGNVCPYCHYRGTR